MPRLVITLTGHRVVAYPSDMMPCPQVDEDTVSRGPSPGTGHGQQLATADDQAVRPEKDQVDEHG